MTYNVIRFFLLARSRDEGDENPGPFLIATCELAGHIWIRNKNEYDSINLKRVAKAKNESCDKKFNEVRNIIRGNQCKDGATISQSRFESCPILYFKYF